MEKWMWTAWSVLVVAGWIAIAKGHMDVALMLWSIPAGSNIGAAVAHWVRGG